MNNKWLYVIGGSALFILVVLLAGSGQKNSQRQISQNVLSVTPSAGPTSSMNSQDPQDIVPGLYKNQIQNTATNEGFTIVTATVENNTDSTGKTIGDHLELSLKNTSGHDLTDFEAYYTITDTVTNKKEGYYKKLTGFVLKNGATQQIHFDNKQGDGHFSANTNSIYFTSSNKLLFDIMVSSPGYKIQTIQVTKDAGGAETKD